MRPHSQHAPDHPLHQARLPHLGSALGMIVLYFSLQFLVGAAVGIAIGLAVGVLGHGQPAAEVFGQLRHELTHPDTNAAMVVVTLLVSAAIVIAWSRRLWPAAWSHGAPPGLGLTRPGRPVYYLAAVVLGLALPLAGSWLTRILAHGHPVTQDVQTLGASTSLPALLPLTLVVVSVGPLVEEILFRGALLSALLRRMPAGAAIAASSLVFACVHLPDLGYLWYAIPSLALLAAGLAWLRLQSGSLWPAVVAHATNNLLAVVAWFVVRP